MSNSTSSGDLLTLAVVGSSFTLASDVEETRARSYSSSSGSSFTLTSGGEVDLDDLAVWDRVYNTRRKKKKRNISCEGVNMGLGGQQEFHLMKI